MENTMASSNVDDKLKKDTENKETGNKETNKILTFIKQNVRYITAGVLFLAMVLILVKVGSPKQPQNGQNVAATEVASEASDDAKQEFEVDAHEDVNTLINQYYTAYAAGDTDTLSTIATPLSENEKSYISVFSQYVDAYQNIKCYTKQGLDASSYLVSVYVEVKFKDVDTVAPGLDFFYVRTNDDGTLYIDNLYSQYNLANQENALDTSVQSLIGQFESESDVVELQSEVQTRYDEALAADENLANMNQTTIPAAIKDWVSQVAAQAATEQTAADTESEQLGTLDQGTVVTRTAVDGDWCVIDYNGTTGYVKNEFLTYDLPDTTADNNSDSSSDNSDSTNSASIAEGTVIMLENTTNIRSGMSEDSSKVGTAYAGEKVTVVMSYAEGWTKVKWNGETGYIKTSLLQ